MTTMYDHKYDQWVEAWCFLCREPMSVQHDIPVMLDHFHEVYVCSEECENKMRWSNV
jgi:hypothetical protein